MSPLVTLRGQYLINGSCERNGPPLEEGVVRPWGI